MPITPPTPRDTQPTFGKLDNFPSRGDAILDQIGDIGIRATGTPRKKRTEVDTRPVDRDLEVMINRADSAARESQFLAAYNRYRRLTSVLYRLPGKKRKARLATQAEIEAQMARGKARQFEEIDRRPGGFTNPTVVARGEPTRGPTQTQKQRAQQRRAASQTGEIVIPGIAGNQRVRTSKTFTRRGPVTDRPGEALAVIVGEQLLEWQRGRFRLRRDARLGRIAGHGGRSAAERARESRQSHTNRTGAAAVRSPGAGPSTGKPAATKSAGPGSAAGTVQSPAPVRPGVAGAPGSGAVGESQASRDARTIMGTSPSLPAPVVRPSVASRVRSVVGSQLGSLVRSQLANLSSARRQGRLNPRTTNETSLLTAANSSLLQLPRNTPLAGSGFAQQPPTRSKSDRCDCPKPEKAKKKEFACSNPVVSRYVKDGIIIIKRKLLCPPSKLK